MVLRSSHSIMKSHQSRKTVGDISVLIGQYNNALLHWSPSNIADLFKGENSRLDFHDIALDKEDMQGTTLVIMHIRAGANNVIQFKGVITFTSTGANFLSLSEEQKTLIKKCLCQMISEYTENQVATNPAWVGVVFPNC
jgi:hypothetical protein